VRQSQPQPPHLQPSNLGYDDDSDDDDDTVQDIHVGPGRPRIVEDKKSDSDDDELSPYVTVRLAVARAKAMAKYREVWG
jgi:hypothetical protein